jgi:teichuronic acid biosynthesis glycosyltransferase TuaG
VISRPLVSVVIPAYNSARYIAESIRSVQEQIYSNWELVVVDDGSTDETAGIVRDFSRTDARVKYVFQENGGQASARNTGIRDSRGDLIAFLDSDDLWFPEKLELQTAKLEEAGADVVFSDVVILYEGGEEENVFFKIPFGRRVGAEMFGLLLETNGIPMASVLARRESLEIAGLFDEDRKYQNCEDYELWIKLARKGAVFYGMEDKLVKYRRHPSSMTHHRVNGLDPFIAVAKKHFQGSDLLPRQVVRRRIRGLYRELISVLVEQGDTVEAGRRMREFAAWDKSNPVTRIQRVLLTLSPGRYNYVSQECLYRIEWHAGRLLSRLRARRKAYPAGGGTE